MNNKKYIEDLKKENKSLVEEKESLLSDIEKLETQQVSVNYVSASSIGPLSGSSSNMVYIDEASWESYSSFTINTSSGSLNLVEAISGLQKEVEELKKKTTPWYKRWFSKFLIWFA